MSKIPKDPPPDQECNLCPQYARWQATNGGVVYKYCAEHFQKRMLEIELTDVKTLRPWDARRQREDIR